MGFLSKIKSWFHSQQSVAEATVENEDPALEQEKESTKETVIENSPVAELSEEEQQYEQVKQFVKSNDLTNHQLAAMFMTGLEIKWDEEMYEEIGKSADKMIFWIQQEVNPDFVLHYTKLNISARFFGQYSEIAEFAAVLPQFVAIEELRWNAKHYWNQHPILVAASQLPKLKRLYAEGCKMNFLPDSLGQATALEELYLSHNRLTEMPDTIEKLYNLKILDLSNNKFEKCPRSACNLKRLEVFRLHKNPLKDIEPRLLGRLYKLRDLQLPEVIAEFNISNLKDWLPDVDFDKPYWKFD